MTKQSGDIHPPELDDGFDEEPPPAAAQPRPVHAVRRSSPMRLLAMLAGVFVLYRLLR